MGYVCRFRQKFLSRNLNLVIIVYLIFFSYLQNIANAQTKKLSLKQAIEYALEHSPEFDSLNIEMKSAVLEEQAAKGKMFPSLDLSTTHGISDQNPRLGMVQSPWVSEFNLALTENIYDNGNLYVQHQIAKKKSEQAKLSFENKRNALSLSIATEFLRYSLALQTQQIQQVQFEMIKKQYDLVSKDYYQGVKTQKDYLRFKTQLSRSEIDLLNVRNLIADSKNELRRLLGVGVARQDELDFQPLDLNQKVSFTALKPLFLEAHSLYQISDLQKKINDLEAELVKKKNRIEVFASAGVGYLSDQYIENGNSFNDRDRMNWNALITVKYNFFDWGVRRKQSDAAELRSKVQSNIEDSKNLNLKKDLEQLMLNLTLYQNQFRLSEELFKLEQTNLNFIEREYRNGKVQYLDFIAGLTNLSDAKSKYFSAVSDLLRSEYTYRYHEGTLYEQINK